MADDALDEVAEAIRDDVRAALREELPGEIAKQISAQFASMPAPIVNVPASRIVMRDVPAPIVKIPEPKTIIQPIPAPVVNVILDERKLASAFAGALSHAPKPEIHFRETTNAPPEVKINLDATAIGKAIADAIRGALEVKVEPRIEVKMPDRQPMFVQFRFDDKGKITGARLTPV